MPKIFALIIAFPLLAADIRAQVVTLTSTTAQVGQPITVTATLSGNPANITTGVSALQWLVSFPIGFTATSVVPSKTLQCSSGGCLLTGGASLLGNGALGTFTFPAPSVATPYPLTGLLGTNSAGDKGGISVTPGPLLTITPAPPFSPCDLNRDGVTDVGDVKLINDALVQAMTVGGTVAPATMDLDQNGRVDVVDAQRVIAAASGQACRVG